MNQEPNIRERIGVTQQAFAEFLHLSLSQIAMYETGKRELPTQALLTISQIEICLLQPPTDIQVENDTKPLNKRYKTCLLQIETAKRQLEKLVQQYIQCCNAITVATNLPKSLPQATPAQLLWLLILADDARQKLTTCGIVPQQLLEIKITALETEAAALLPLLSPL